VPNALRLAAADEMLTVAQAARLCHVDYDTFLRWIAKGALEHMVVGPCRRKRVWRRDVERLIRPGELFQK
jgi:excisionase family DNA binding protein